MTNDYIEMDEKVLRHTAIFGAMSRCCKILASSMFPRLYNVSRLQHSLPRTLAVPNTPPTQPVTIELNK